MDSGDRGAKLFKHFISLKLCDDFFSFSFLSLFPCMLSVGKYTHRKTHTFAGQRFFQWQKTALLLLSFWCFQSFPLGYNLLKEGTCTERSLHSFTKNNQNFLLFMDLKNGFIDWRCRPVLVKSQLSFCIFFLKQHEISEWMRFFIEWWILTVLAWRQICSFVSRVKYFHGCLHLLSFPVLFIK